MLRGPGPQGNARSNSSKAPDPTRLNLLLDISAQILCGTRDVFRIMGSCRNLRIA